MQKTGLEMNDFIGEEAEGLTRKQINKIKKIGVKKIKVSQIIVIKEKVKVDQISLK